MQTFDSGKKEDGFLHIVEAHGGKLVFFPVAVCRLLEESFYQLDMSQTLGVSLDPGIQLGDKGFQV